MVLSPGLPHLSKSPSYTTFQDHSSRADGELGLRSQSETDLNNLQSRKEHKKSKLKKTTSSKSKKSTELPLGEQNRVIEDASDDKNGKCTDCIVQCASTTFQKVKSAIKVCKYKKPAQSLKDNQNKGSWKEVWDQKLKCHYFVHHPSKEITYDMTPYCESRSCILYKTAVFVDGCSSISDSSEQLSENRSKDSLVQKPKRVYYYNTQTRKSFWEIPTVIWRPIVIMLDQQQATNNEEIINQSSSSNLKKSIKPSTRQLYYFNVLTAEYTINQPEDLSTIIPSKHIAEIQTMKKNTDTLYKSNTETDTNKRTDDISYLDVSHDSYSTVQFEISSDESEGNGFDQQNVISNLDSNVEKENSRPLFYTRQSLKSVRHDEKQDMFNVHDGKKDILKEEKNKSSTSSGWETRSNSSTASNATMTTTSSMTVTTEETETQQSVSHEEWERLYKRQMALYDLLNHHCPNNKAENLKFISFITSQNDISMVTADLKKIIDEIPYDALSYFIMRYISNNLPSSSSNIIIIKEEVHQGSKKTRQDHEKDYPQKKKNSLSLKIQSPKVGPSNKNGDETKNKARIHSLESPTKSIVFANLSSPPSSLSSASLSSESTSSSLKSTCSTSSESSLRQTPVINEGYVSSTSESSSSLEPNQPLLQIGNDGVCYSLQDESNNNNNPSYQTPKKTNNPVVVTPNYEDLYDLPFDQASDLSLAYSLSPPANRQNIRSVQSKREGHHSDDQPQDSLRPYISTSRYYLDLLPRPGGIGQTNDLISPPKRITPEKNNNFENFEDILGLPDYLQTSRDEYRKKSRIQFRQMNLNYGYNPYASNSLASDDEEEQYEQEHDSNEKYTLREQEMNTSPRGRTRERQR